MRVEVLVTLLTLGVFPCTARAAIPSAPVPDCGPFAQRTLKELTEPREDFVRSHNSEYSDRLETTPICDQETAGTCWIYSTVGEIQTAALKETGKKLDLSETYLDVMSLRTRILDSLETPMEEVVEGGWTNAAYWMIQRHGVIPESAWRPRIDIADAGIRKRLMRFLNDGVGNYHLEAAKLTDPAAVSRLKKETQKRLFDLIEDYTGPLPTTVTLQGRALTPVEYARELFPIGKMQIGRVSPIRPPLPQELERMAAAKLTPQGPEAHPTLTYNIDVTGAEGSFEDIEKAIIEHIRRGRSVPLSFEVDNAFIDRATGIMSIKAFHLPDGYYPLPPFYRRAADSAGGGHAVEVVGVDVGADGRVIKYLIKNSWGTDVGDKGFYHMYPDYFETYLHSVYFRL